jgi:hypothetical protein
VRPVLTNAAAKKAEGQARETAGKPVGGNNLDVLVTILAVLVIVLIAGILIVLRLVYDEWWVVGAAGTALATYVIALAVARASGARFWPTALAIFVGVGVFGATLSVLRFWGSKQVQPVAVLRTGEGGAVCGAYVAEADDRLYLARLDHAPQTGGNATHLFWVVRKEEVGWALGELQSRDAADAAVRVLATRVLDERRVRKSVVVESVTSETTPASSTKPKGTRTETTKVTRHAKRGNDESDCSIWTAPAT